MEKITVKIEHNIKTDTVFSSPEKFEGNPVFKVKRTENGVYFCEIPSIDKIAVVLYDPRRDRYGVLFEKKESLFSRFNKEMKMVSALKGPVNKSPRESCFALLEKNGIQVPTEDVYPIGKTFVCEESNQLYYGYIVNFGNTSTSNTSFELDSIEWLTIQDIMEFGDWSTIWIISKATYFSTSN